MSQVQNDGPPVQGGADQQHSCQVKLQGDDHPFLAFAPTSGVASAFSNSLFTLDLKAGTTRAQADALAAQINALLRGVSTTVF